MIGQITGLYCLLVVILGVTSLNLHAHLLIAPAERVFECVHKRTFNLEFCFRSLVYKSIRIIQIVTEWHLKPLRLWQFG